MDDGAETPADCWPSATFDDLKDDFPDPPRLAGFTDQVLGLLSRPLFRLSFGHEPSCERRRRGRRWVASIALVLVVVGWFTYAALDETLAAMHKAGAPAASIIAVSKPGASSDRVHQTFEVWRLWDAQLDVPARAASVVRASLVLEAALVALPLSYLLGLVALRGWDRARRLRQSLESEANPARLARADALVTIAALAVPTPVVYLAADWCENVGLFLLVDRTGTSWLTWAVVGLTWLKWLALAIALLPAALALVNRRLWRSDTEPAALEEAETDRPPMWRILVALRAPVFAVAVFALILLQLGGDIGRQVEDVVLRWHDDLFDLGAALVLVVVVVGAVRWVGLASLTYSERYRVSLGSDGGPAAVTAPVSSSDGPALAAVPLLLGGLGLVAAALLRGPAYSWSIVLIPPSVAALIFGLLNLPKSVRALRPAVREPPPVEPHAPWVLRMLEALVPLAVAVVVLRGTTKLFVVNRPAAAWTLVGLATALIALAIVLGAEHRAIRWVSTPRRVLLIATTVVLLGLAVYAGVDPWSAGRLGSVAMLLTACGALTVLAGGLAWVERYLPARGALAVLGFTRVPLIILLVVWMSAASLLDTVGTLHDTRLAQQPWGRTIDLDTAFDDWVANSGAASFPGDTAPDGRPVVPMVFVASAGGGVRAAYWTGLVLDCVFSAQPVASNVERDGSPVCPEVGDDRVPNVFMGSGISGGSVGLATDLVLSREDQPSLSRFDPIFSEDFLAPTLAGFAFRDVPNGLLRTSAIEDRAGVLEQAWERSFRDNGVSFDGGFSAMSFDDSGRPRFPLLLLNGATIDDGCRLAVSVVDLSSDTGGRENRGATEDCLTIDRFVAGSQDPPTSIASTSTDATDAGATTSTTAPPSVLAARRLSITKDAADYTCDSHGQDRRDLRVSTAALLSARFPFISPTGGLWRCDRTDDPEGAPERRSFDVDGGALDTSGAEPLAAVWERLAPRVRDHNVQSSFCIAPRLLLLDNGYADTTVDFSSARPQELFAPAAANSLARDSRTAAARQEAVFAFERAFSDVSGTCGMQGRAEDDVALVAPVLAPGVHAPLGWTLSSFSRVDLQDQLAQPRNAAALQRVGQWFRAGPG